MSHFTNDPDPLGHAADDAEPIDMVLHCPKCGMQHIDAPSESREIRGGELCVETWDNPPHRSHKCKACGCIWRPADVPTNGVKAVATRGKVDTWPTGTIGRDGLLRAEALQRAGTHADGVAVPAPAAPFTCWGLSSFCAEVGHKCRAAGACIYTPPKAAGEGGNDGR